MAATTCSATDSLEFIPDDICVRYLPEHDKLADRILKRALNFYTQGYIHKIKIYDSQKPKIKVSAKCWRSMRKSESPHQLNIEIQSEQRRIIESYCSCTVGLTGHCSHVVGLIKSLQGLKLHNIKHVPDELSCTSVPQQWHVPRGDKIAPCPINHVVVAKPCEGVRKRKPVVCQIDPNTKSNVSDWVQDSECKAPNNGIYKLIYNSCHTNSTPPLEFICNHLICSTYLNIIAKLCQRKIHQKCCSRLNSTKQMNRYTVAWRLPKVTSTDIERLKQTEGTPLEYVLSPNHPMVTTRIGEVQLGSALSYQTRNLRSIEPVTTSGCGNLKVNNAAAVQLPEKYHHLRAGYNVDDPEQLEQSTRDQSSSVDWINARQSRVTSSVFGEIVQRKSKPTEKMLARLFSSKEINAPSLSYGKRNESKAKAKYLSQHPDRHVHECGFIVSNEFPFLGATPDGKVCDKGQTGLIEVKCPYSARDLTLAEACEKPGFFIEKHEEEFKLNKNHAYYKQVQGQLMISGCTFCDFVVYCPKESKLFVERIFPDKEFMLTMLNSLCEFFANDGLAFVKKNC